MRSAARSRPKLLFLAPFPPPGSQVFGGNFTDAQSLLDSSLPDRLELQLLDVSHDAPGQSFAARARAALRRAGAYVAALRADRPAAVLMFSSGGFSFVERSLYCAYARALGIPALLSIRSGHFLDQCRRSRAFRLLARVLVKAPALLLCQGTRWQRFFGEDLGTPAERCPIVDAWVATEGQLEVGKARADRDSPVVNLLFLGALEPFKGVRELLQAAEALRGVPGLPPFSLVLAGEGSLGAELRAQVGARGLGSMVSLPGLLTGEAKLEALRRADVFVLPSYTEGLPNAMIEAMAAGLAVVVTPVGSIPDVIVHEETGLLVPCRDADGLARGLRALIESRQARARLGAAAYACAERRFSAERGARRIEQLVLRATGAGEATAA